MAVPVANSGCFLMLALFSSHVASSFSFMGMSPSPMTSFAPVIRGSRPFGQRVPTASGIHVLGRAPARAPLLVTDKEFPAKNAPLIKLILAVAQKINIRRAKHQDVKSESDCTNTPFISGQGDAIEIDAQLSAISRSIELSIDLVSQWDHALKNRVLSPPLSANSGVALQSPSISSASRSWKPAGYASKSVRVPNSMHPEMKMKTHLAPLGVHMMSAADQTWELPKALCYLASNQTSLHVPIDESVKTVRHVQHVTAHHAAYHHKPYVHAVSRNVLSVTLSKKSILSLGYTRASSPPLPVTVAPTHQVHIDDINSIPRSHRTAQEEMQELSSIKSVFVMRIQQIRRDCSARIDKQLESASTPALPLSNIAQPTLAKISSSAFSSSSSTSSSSISTKAVSCAKSAAADVCFSDRFDVIARESSERLDTYMRRDSKCVLPRSSMLYASNLALNNIVHTYPPTTASRLAAERDWHSRLTPFQSEIYSLIAGWRAPKDSIMNAGMAGHHVHFRAHATQSNPVGRKRHHLARKPSS